jgi:L-ornithine N5-oxygenase
MSWCASRVVRENSNSLRVDYGERVERIEHVPEKDAIRVWSVRNDTGERRERLARNLIVSTGGTPSVPSAFEPLRRATSTTTGTATRSSSNNVLHTSEYLVRIKETLEGIRGRKDLRVAVVGAGQSAAEVFLDVKGRLEDVGAEGAEIHLLHKRGNLHPSDDSPYAFAFLPSRASGLMALD